MDININSLEDGTKLLFNHCVYHDTTHLSSRANSAGCFPQIPLNQHYA